MNPAAWIEQHAGRTPDKLALQCGAQHWSYARLWREVERLASALTASGVKTGDRIAWLGLNSPQQIAMLAACARVAACFMPINWRLTAGEQAPMLAESEPALLVVDAPFVETRHDLPASFRAIRMLALQNPPPGWSSYDAFVAGASLPPPRAKLTLPRAPLLLCYTSGSSGRPKGVLLSHQAVCSNAENSIALHELCSDDVVLTTLPLFHVGGLNNQTTPALKVGASVILHPKFDVLDTFDAIEHDHVTLTVLVPAQLAAMMAHPRWISADFSALRMITTGSTIVPEHVTQAVHARGVPLVQIYGSTETCPIAAALQPQDAQRKAGSTGLPARHCAVRVVDDQDHDVAPGELGQVLVRGPNLMNGYWRQPEVTAQALAGGWFHSGDIGHLDAEGYLYIDGRSNDMIISGGENIAPAEIENVLLGCDEISEACIVGAPDARWGQIVVAVIAPRLPGSLTEAGVLALLDGRVARYKLPKQILFVDALPKTALGKVRKSDVRLLLDPQRGTRRDPITETQA